MATNQCRHPACDCEVDVGEAFCSESCREASTEAAEHARCDCDHDACGRLAALGDERTGESGRIGYLVLYMMGVPVGVLLLLWVLFGSNLIGAG
jgi:hypothetical protein